jgi:hypothetical protein
MFLFFFVAIDGLLSSTKEKFVAQLSNGAKDGANPIMAPNLEEGAQTSGALSGQEFMAA